MASVRGGVFFFDALSRRWDMRFILRSDCIIIEEFVVFFFSLFI